MGIETSIQWTDGSWNIAVGCSKVDADCKYCYMYRQGLNATRYKVGTHLAKQLKMKDRHGGDFNEFPASIKYREFPKP